MKYFSVVFLTLSVGLVAQGYVDIARFDSYFSPSKNKQDKPVNLSIGQIQLFLPLVKNEKNTVFFNPRWEGLQIKTENETFQLVQAAYPLGYKREVTDKGGYTLIVLPRLNGPVDISFQIGTLNTYNFKNSDKFSQRLGFYANQEFFGLFLLPLYGMDWKINENWRAFGLLPVNASIENRKNNKIAYGVSFNAFINSFRFYQTEKYPGYLQRNTNELYLYSDLYLTEKLVLQAKAGYSIGRSYKYYPENQQVDFQVSLARFGDNRTKRDPIFDDGFIFQLNLAYRTRTNWK